LEKLAKLLVEKYDLHGSRHADGLCYVNEEKDGDSALTVPDIERRLHYHPGSMRFDARRP
jgi:hypothetical protein